MKKLIVTASAAGLAITGLAVVPAEAAAPAAGVKWGKCSDPRLQKAGAECGYVQAPLDYGRPGGAKVQLAVSRIKHKSPDSKYQGVMLVNPGGPGGSGLGLSTLGAAVPNGVGNNYDWIGFDPRGVGESKPALSCNPNYFSPNRPNYIPTTAALEKTWLARSKSYANACKKNNAALLSHIKTTDAAKDMDSIRVALGAKQINYYGFSYGTYLGQVYSTLYPSRVRRMVLDSNVDPRRVWYNANLDQDVAFNRNIKIWFNWLARNDKHFKLGKTEKAVEKLWYAQRAKLAKHPAAKEVGPDEWTDIFIQAGYFRDLWNVLGSAFSGWIHKSDGKLLQRLYRIIDSVGDDNGFAVYNAVQCSDVQWPTSWNKWRRDNWATHMKAPFETWSNAWYNAPCFYWPAKAGKPVNVDGRKVKDALLIGEELDAATPFTGSLEVRRRFPNASLIGEPGGSTHADSLAGNACVDDKIADYLATGKLPKRKPGNRPDVTCKPLPDPKPGATAARTQPERIRSIPFIRH